MAFAAVGVVLAVAVPWVLIQDLPHVSIRTGSSPASPSDGGYEIHPPVIEPSAANPMPRLTLPGWTTTSYSERSSGSPAPGPNGYLAILEDPHDPASGRSVRIGVATFPAGYSGGTNPQPVDINGSPGVLTESTSSMLVRWFPASGTTIYVVAEGLTASEVLDVARGLRLADDFRSADLTVTPTDLVARPLNPLTNAERITATYMFERAGQRIQLTLYDNGPQGYEQRLSDHETPRAIRVQGADAVLQDQGRGRFRIDLLDGWWTWEADGGPFASADDFTQTIDAIRGVDRDTWHATLPDEVVTKSERPAAINEILMGIPLPSGFDRAALERQPLTERRYDLAADVVTAVTCAWVNRWFDANERQDAAAAAEALDAMSSSTNWPILQAMTEGGDFSEVIWRLAPIMENGGVHDTGATTVTMTRDAFGTCR
ncbi:MAG: hypothetical protein ABWY80_06965 [Acidimicrobiia bacterium]